MEEINMINEIESIKEFLRGLNEVQLLDYSVD